ncbi:MAG: Gx transporter family protein [Ruminococcaceae bacterium]|nr:Gx transporter family protein [Oscillospiraceae bacterium]
MDRNGLTATSLSRLGLLTAVGIALHIAEGLLPAVGMIPGGKIGLANVVTVIVLFAWGGRAAFCVNIVRALVASLLTGGGMSMVYALAGAVCSCAVMILLSRLKHLSPIGVSVAGAATHNAAQVAVAAIILRTGALVPYLAILLAISCVSGIGVGIVASVSLNRIPFLTK